MFLTGLAITPGKGAREDDDLAARTHFRMSGALEGRENDIREDHAP